MNRLQSHENGSNSTKFYVNSPAINRKLVLIFMRFRFDSLVIKQALREDRPVCQWVGFGRLVYNRRGLHPAETWFIHIPDEQPGYPG